MSRRITTVDESMFMVCRLTVPVIQHSKVRLGTALVKSHFPSWTYDSETFFLACLLHDIGEISLLFNDWDAKMFMFRHGAQIPVNYQALI